MNVDISSMGVPQQKINQGNVQIKSSPETEERLTKTEAGKENDSGQGDKVSLSIEGRQKQADEVSGGGGSPADAVIARIKEQIEKIKEQLEALQGDKSPEAEEKRKMLREQLSVLNASLFDAIDKKTKAAQKT
ncbi:FlxA-like family protein [Psychromonas sp. SR45-3]|uniref:FlxA-like family protein n=1 Tax=Psychromonas sp. SR45-3 TaxID=2760930 RepID=UPI0015FA5F86|nr:FlxA-like family protein [Psychromonas sp. SR45-3]MBB1271847.1 FlxA-like family protein [Psychromonas sp. SR45-3]